MKVFILTDLEGAAGVYKFEHCNSAGKFYQRSCRLLTKELNSAVEGALLAGAEEIVIWDGHGSGGIDPELIHDEPRVIYGPVENCGLDDTFDCMLVVGQHAKNRTPKANLCHSYNSRAISEMRLNGEPIGELGVRTIMAGYLEVPLVLVTGDDKTCQEAEDLVGTVETAAVKKGMGRETVSSLSPQKAGEKIKKRTISALTSLDKYEPYTIEPPFKLETDYFEIDPENEDSRALDRPIARTEVKESNDFLEIAH